MHKSAISLSLSLSLNFLSLFRSFLQIGSWVNEKLSINTSQAEFYQFNGNSLSPLTWSQLPPAQCDAGKDCLKCDYDVSNDIIFIEGDFYVVGIVPVSDKKPYDLLTCGVIKGFVGADIAQSIVFAVEEVNNKTGMFTVSCHMDRSRPHAFLFTV